MWYQGYCSSLKILFLNSNSGALKENKEWYVFQSPLTQFTPMGISDDHLCQVFNCFGNRILIPQPMAFILLEEARKPWQGSCMRKTTLASLLPTCCPTLGTPCAHLCTDTCDTLAEDPYGFPGFLKQKEAKTH